MPIQGSDSVLQGPRPILRIDTITDDIQEVGVQFSHRFNDFGIRVVSGEGWQIAQWASLLRRMLCALSDTPTIDLSPMREGHAGLSDAVEANTRRMSTATQPVALKKSQ